MGDTSHIRLFDMQLSQEIFSVFSTEDGLISISLSAKTNIT